MPVYRNDGTETYRERGLEIAPGAIGSSIPNKYLRNPGSLVLVADSLAPWVTLHADVLDATITDMAKYKEIHITNNSGAIIEFTVNGDTTNVRALLDKDTVKIEQDWEINSMSITGEGSGKVYVYGTL